jgi:hypothetical protein
LTWTLPALAPALGVLGLATAFPAIAGQARTWFARAALGAIGAWWLLLAEALLHRVLLTGEDARGTAAHVLATLVTGGSLLQAAVFAAAAAPLPWLIRGRSAALDAIAAAAWAGALGAAATAAAHAVHAPQPRGAAAGAALAGALAFAIRWFLDARLDTVHRQDGHSTA